MTSLPALWLGLLRGCPAPSLQSSELNDWERSGGRRGSPALATPLLGPWVTQFSPRGLQPSRGLASASPSHRPELQPQSRPPAPTHTCTSLSSSWRIQVAGTAGGPWRDPRHLLRILPSGMKSCKRGPGVLIEGATGRACLLRPGFFSEPGRATGSRVFSFPLHRMLSRRQTQAKATRT